MSPASTATTPSRLETIAICSGVWVRRRLAAILVAGWELTAPGEDEAEHFAGLTEILTGLVEPLASAHGGMGQWAWPRIAAVYVIAIAPGIVVFAFAQKYFFSGLMEGALKA